MDDPSKKESEGTYVEVDPGICGFRCTVVAHKSADGTATISINDSDCEQVRNMSQFFKGIGLQDIFSPISKNPVYRWAERAHCHTTCIVALAVLKAIEVEMGLALPKGASFSFKKY